MEKAQLEKAAAAPSKEEKLNQLSKLLDEAIAEYETLCKAELAPQELSLQPDAQGDMAAVAHQAAAPLAQAEEPKAESKAEEKPEEKKEEVKKEVKKEEEKEEEKPEEKKDEEKEEDEDKEERPEEDEEEKDEEMEKFEALLSRTLAKWGLFKAEDEEEDEEDKKEEKEEEKKEEVKKAEESVKDDALLKSLDGRMEKFEDALLKLTEKMEKIARMPVSEKKSLNGLQPIRKSMEEAPAQASKGQVIDKLLDLQKSGDTRVTPNLVTQFEMTGDLNLVKDIIR